MHDLAGARRSSAPPDSAPAIAAGVSTATMSVPSIATAPGVEDPMGAVDGDDDAAGDDQRRRRRLLCRAGCAATTPRRSATSQQRRERESIMSLELYRESRNSALYSLWRRACPPRRPSAGSRCAGRRCATRRRRPNDFRRAANAHQRAAGRRGAAGRADADASRRDAARSGARHARRGGRGRGAGAARRTRDARRACWSSCRSARVGHIGLQRDERTAVASQYYAKLPHELEDSFVLMIDPMLATGGSAVAALDMLTKAGARASTAGLHRRGAGRRRARRGSISGRRRSTRRWSTTELNAQKFIVPGLGDFGDRLYGTI